MEIWTKKDAELILHLFSCGSTGRTAHKIAHEMGVSYTYILMRMRKLCDFGIVNKIRRGIETYYTSPSKQAVIKALVIRDGIKIDEAKKYIENLLEKSELKEDSPIVKKAKALAKAEAEKLLKGLSQEKNETKD